MCNFVYYFFLRFLHSNFVIDLHINILEIVYFEIFEISKRINSSQNSDNAGSATMEFTLRSRISVN